MPPTQLQHFWMAHDAIARLNALMMEMLFGPDPISDDELRALIARRPERYGRFAGYLGTRT